VRLDYSNWEAAPKRDWSTEFCWMGMRFRIICLQMGDGLRIEC
jgi:hypothetical protein